MSYRVALVSLHTSPVEAPGSGDAGGMNVYLVGLADALAARGVEVELLTRATDENEGVLAAFTPGGVPVRSLLAGPRASVAKGRLGEFTAEFGRSMAELPRFDVVHSHYWLSGRAALPVARHWGAPHVQSLHTVAALKNDLLAPGDAPEPDERLEGERMLVHESALTIAATRAERDAIVHDYGAAAGRVAIVTPGVDTTLFHPSEPTLVRRPDGVSATWRTTEEADRESGRELQPFPAQSGPTGSAAPGSAPTGRPVVLMLARLQPLKAPDLAIAAVAAIPRERRPLLVIAGGTSPGHDGFRARLGRQVHELGLEGDVVFLPAQSREATAALLRDAALLVLPSHSETFGMVALEAAASGTPVVASHTSGLVESVADGASGVLVASRDPDAWGRVIDALLADPLRLAALSSSALEHARRHTWSITATQIAAHYERLLAAIPEESGA